MAAFSSYPLSKVRLAVVVGGGQCLMTVATNENTGSFLAGAVGIGTQLIVGAQTVGRGREFFYETNATR